MVRERPPQEIRQLDTQELSRIVSICERRIETGQASDQDYVQFIMCQLELAERGVVGS